MKYAVEQQYYSNGVVNAYIREVSDNFQDVRKEGRSVDIYIDVFNTKKEAQAFLNECLEA